jgi:hypothetical protein
LFIRVVVPSVSEYPPGSREDREMLAEMTPEKLLDLFFLQVRNLWRVDGLYFLGIEKRYGAEAAAEIDSEVWKTMGTIEAKSLQRMFPTRGSPSILEIVLLLRKSSWAMDQPFKALEVNEKHGTLWVKKCRTQETRLAKGLPEFPCKRVRFGYLKEFAEALNPKVSVNCIVCPPDKHPKESWCKWEFTL